MQVLFVNNHESDYHHTAKWIDSILKLLHQKYGVTRFNAVAHSWGNNAIMYYLENYSQKKNQPQNKKRGDLVSSFLLPLE